MFDRCNRHRIVGIRHRLGQLHRLLLRRNQTALPLLNLARHPLRTLTLERELLLGARDLGIDFVEPALSGVLRVVFAEDILPQAFKLRHQRLQIGLFRQQRGLGFTKNFHCGFALTHRLFPALREEQRLRLKLLFFQFAITRGDFRLPVQPLDLRRQFDLNIVNTRQILFGVGEPTFGLLASFFVARYARRLFQKNAQLFRLRLDDARNHALLNHSIRTRAEARPKEHIQNIATTHGLVVQVIAGANIALHDALDRELGVLAPLPRRATARVVKHQFDAGTRHWLPVPTAVENHVIHRFAAQGRGFALAKHPAHCVDHVGFAAPIGADDAD